jgi:hypothetical protein
VLQVIQAEKSGFQFPRVEVVPPFLSPKHHKLHCFIITFDHHRGLMISFVLPGRYVRGAGAEKVFNRYDSMSLEMGLNSPKFTVLHASAVAVMKLKFVKYMKDLGKQRQFALGLPVAESDGIAEDGAGEVPAMTISANGYPVLPDIIDFSTKTQEHLADVMRQYLSMHYSTLMLSVMLSVLT